MNEQEGSLRHQRHSDNQLQSLKYCIQTMIRRLYVSVIQRNLYQWEKRILRDSIDFENDKK